jgi:hypothetical protein
VSKKVFMFIAKRSVRFFCALTFLFLALFKADMIFNPLPWRQQVIVIGIIMGIGFLVCCFFWSISVKRKRTTVNLITSKQKLRYVCPACGRSWDDSELPKDGLCTFDKVRLRSFDPIEDRNTHSL